ncbi:hypothetical protein M758_12G103200 [Ceratodon purpureus]|nr:hypothetical protein M758_12G103200 [Ceratodon purpureus]
MAPHLGGDVPFKLSLTGYGGNLSVVKLPPVCRDSPLSNLPDLVLPSPFPAETRESALRKIEEEYLTPCLDEAASDVALCGKQWDFDWFDEGSLELQPSLPRLAVAPVWEPPYRRGKNDDTNECGVEDWIPDFEQVETEHANLNSQNSSSVLRKPGHPEDFVRGSTSNHPFRPGGFDLPQSSGKTVPLGALNGDWLREVLHGGPLQKVAPGFKHGIDFGLPEPYLELQDWDVTADASRSAEAQESSVFNHDGGVSRFDDLFKKNWEENETPAESDEEEVKEIDKEASAVFLDVQTETVHRSMRDQEVVLDEVLGDPKDVVKSAKANLKKPANREVWAVMEPVPNIAQRFEELVPDLALSFPFKLDTFQKEAIYHLERNESVFVAAHTSAGKTVVAEYAFALAAKQCTRAVYTSPIKTISNQKFRDFGGKFDVGLLTGDVSLRPEASCLIMTTEILRSMLYKGADIIRDIEWVIFDEVHYVNDVERGVVWEEVIIMLPPHVNLVMLSATVPNTFEFADWIGRTKKKKIYVTGTMQRPVPLEHCIYYGGELYKICEQSTFLPEGIKEAQKAHLAKTTKSSAGSGVGSPGQGRGGGTQGRGGGPPGRGGGMAGRGGDNQKGGGRKGPTSKQVAQGTIDSAMRGGGTGWRSETSQWYTLINNLNKKGLLPVVVFCFSKNRCDQSADSLSSIDLTIQTEKSEIYMFCQKAFSRLKGSDRRLPQVVRVGELLKRGIGVHHAGLLPIVKEVVEMLFCRGVIKVLFSTETFAMGVNAPARTVAFHSLRKHDGKTFRQILPGEYTQMAGRAGRRGLDKVGTVVIMCWDDIPEEGDLKRLLTGKPTKLESQFRLTYSMILNLLRVEDLKVEDMLKRSFAEFHAQRALPEQQQQLLEREGALSKMNVQIDCILGEPSIEDYFKVSLEYDKLGDKIQEAVMQSRGGQQALVAGRVVLVRNAIVPVPTLGVIVRAGTGNAKSPIVLALHRAPLPAERGNPAKSAVAKATNELAQEGYFISKKGRDNSDDFFMGVGSRKGTGVMKITLPHYGTAAGLGYVVMEVDNHGFLSLCKAKIRVDSARLLEDNSPAAYTSTVKELLQLEQEYPGQDPPALDLLKDLKFTDFDVVEAYRRQQSLLEVLAHNKCHKCPKLQEHYTLVKNQHILKERVKELKYELSDAALQQMPDFGKRIEVLQEVGCIDAELVVQLKGRVACELNSCDELIATECLFDNQLGDLTPAEAVALLSSLVFQQKDASEPMLTERLEQAKDRLYNTAIRLGHVQKSFDLSLDPEDYARGNLKFGLMEVVYEWAKGTPFADICEITNVPEGSIVRTIVRLDETCREFRNAARLIGDSTLFEKMEQASNAIKRDIVFAASLYVTGVPVV